MGRRTAFFVEDKPKARPRSVILRTLFTKMILSGLISACTLNKQKKSQSI
jgi:hypothetical protein